MAVAGALAAEAPDIAGHKACSRSKSVNLTWSIYLERARQCMRSSGNDPGCQAGALYQAIRVLESGLRRD